MLIRNAEPKDVPSIWRFIIRLCARRRLPGQIVRNAGRQADLYEGRVKQGLPVLVAWTMRIPFSVRQLRPFRPREGYRLTAEHSVYVDPAAQRRGIGKALLKRLVDIAADMKLHVLVGVIDGDNAASIALHEKLGFHVAGRLPEAGTKFGRWLDLVFVARVLGPMQSPKA